MAGVALLATSPCEGIHLTERQVGEGKTLLLMLHLLEIVSGQRMKAIVRKDYRTL
jgi:hypothetical protein